MFIVFQNTTSQYIKLYRLNYDDVCCDGQRKTSVLYRILIDMELSCSTRLFTHAGICRVVLLLSEKHIASIQYMLSKYGSTYSIPICFILYDMYGKEWKALHNAQSMFPESYNFGLLKAKANRYLLFTFKIILT